MSGRGPDEADATQELVEIRLVGLPLDLHRRSQEHTDELVREFTLMAERLAGQPEAEQHPLPPRLVALVGQLTRLYGTFTEETEERLDRAESAGAVTIDLTLRLPPSAAQAALALDALLDEADVYCRQGEHLLTLATAAGPLRYRRWYLGEVAAQIEGAEPTPWSSFSG